MRPDRDSLVAWLLVAVVLVGLAGCSPPGDDSAPLDGSGDSAASTTAAGIPRWEEVEGLAVARDDFATAIVGRQIWVLGGMTGDRGNRLDSAEVFDTRRGTWQTSSIRLPEPLAAFEAVAVGSRIFAFGGLDRDSRASDFAGVLDTRTGRWSRLPALPEARYAHTVTAHRGKFYVIGGLRGSRAVDQVDIFDPATETWSTGRSMPRARGSHDAVAVAGVIYVLGGWLGTVPTRAVQTYDPERDRWRRGPALPQEVSRGGAAVLRGQIWVAHHEFTAVLTAGLSASQDGWAPAAPMTMSRHGLGLVSVGELLYAIGGCTEEPLRDVRTVDVLDPGDLG